MLFLYIKFTQDYFLRKILYLKLRFVFTCISECKFPTAANAFLETLTQRGQRKAVRQYFETTVYVKHMQNKYHPDSKAL